MVEHSLTTLASEEKAITSKKRSIQPSVCFRQTSKQVDCCLALRNIALTVVQGRYTKIDLSLSFYYFTLIAFFFLCI